MSHEVGLERKDTGGHYQSGLVLQGLGLPVGQTCHAALRAAREVSESEFTKRQAPEKSRWRVIGPGTTTQRMPAARAARNPLSESSKIKTSSGATPRLWAACTKRLGSGFGFPVSSTVEK